MTIIIIIIIIFSLSLQQKNQIVFFFSCKIKSEYNIFTVHTINFYLCFSLFLPLYCSLLPLPKNLTHPLSLSLHDIFVHEPQPLTVSWSYLLIEAISNFKPFRAWKHQWISSPTRRCLRLWWLMSRQIREKKKKKLSSWNLKISSNLKISIISL